MNTKSILLAILLPLVLPIGGWAQVTVGGELEPNDGALLELKERPPTLDNITAYKGFGLPRVNLPSKNNLFPMFTDDLSGGYAEGVKSAEDKKHIGLVVYCIGDDSACSTFPSGVYVWDGKEWIPLYSPKDYYDESTEILTDYEGNSYTTQLMPDGRRWMTQNLRSLKYIDGSWIDAAGGVYMNPALGGGGPVARIKTSFPNTTVTFTVNGASNTLFYEDFAYVYGLMYTPTQAASAILCPCGWHVSTSDEWINLGEKMGGSKTGSGNDITIGNVGKALKSDNYQYIASDSPIVWSYNGFSPGSASNSEFNAPPTGSIYKDGGGNILGEIFGAAFDFVTQDAFRVYPSSGDDLGIVSGYGEIIAASVRCVKDY